MIPVFIRLALTALALLASGAPAGEAAAPVRPLDIVLIGDSHSVGPFGCSMQRRLSAVRGARVWLRSVTSSHPGSWIDRIVHPVAYRHNDAGSIDCAPTPGSHATPKLEEELAAIRDRVRGELVVIVEQGSNLWDYANERSWKIPHVRALADVAARGADRCFWIGPPHMIGGGDPDAAARARRDASLAELDRWLAEQVGSRCRYIPSLSITRYDPGWADYLKLHYPDDAGAAWAGAIFHELGPVLR